MKAEPIVIRSIDASVKRYPLHPDRAIAWAHGVHNHTVCLVVEVSDDCGCTGYGETVLLLNWTGEDGDLAVSFVNQYLAPRLVGLELGGPQEAIDLMDELAWGWQASKGAVDCAIWDLWGKHQKQSVVELLGDRASTERIPVRVSIGGFDVDRTVRLARQYRRLGVRVLKFKVGVGTIDDAHRLAAVRAEVGDGPVFTIDANGAYSSADDAVRAYEKMAESQISLFEQPTPRRRISMLAEVRRRIDIPVMADESVFGPDELEEVLALEACDLVSLYPGKNGGFTRCLAMARRAEMAGIKCAIGSALETDLGQGAMAALAASHRAFDVAGVGHDFQAALMYEKSTVREPICLEDGHVNVPKGAGFAVEPVW